MNSFEYYEIRPCIEKDGYVVSFASYEEYADWRSRNSNREADFWTLYGRYLAEDDTLQAIAIGDFKTEDVAFEIMNAILAPLDVIRDMLTMDGELPAEAIVCEDIINQSSIKGERL